MTGGGTRASGQATEGRESPPRRILLVDCDMFYVQVARLEDPEGAGREELLIVGGSPTGRGVVTSASYPVRAFGVRSGMPTSQALRLCPEAKVIPVSRKACAARSRKVREALEILAPVVQAASIDEFYLDMTGMERLLHGESLEDTARRVRRQVLNDAEIAVSVGGGTRKLVAKLAAGRAKPGGVLVVPAGSEEAFMATFTLREIPGVGPALAGILEARGLRAVPDLLAVEEDWLGKWLGPARARWLLDRARGVDPSPVNPGEPRKSVSTEHTFPTDLHDDRALEREIMGFAATVGATLRRNGLRGRTVTVKIRDADFRTRQAGHTLPEPVDADGTLYSVGRELLKELRRKRKVGVRLLGLGVSSLVEEDAPPQFELFREHGPSEPDRLRVVSRVMDDLRDRFGDDAILPGRMLEGSGAEGLGAEGSDAEASDAEASPPGHNSRSR
jgi:DNA polymerase IV